LRHAVDAQVSYREQYLLIKANPSKDGGAKLRDYSLCTTRVGADQVGRAARGNCLGSPFRFLTCSS